jgi:hypothetical protein
LAIVYHCHSEVGGQLSLPLDVVYWLLAVGYCLLSVDYWLLDVGCWVLAVGCWLLAVGYWLLAVGCWLLAVGYCLLLRLPLFVLLLGLLRVGPALGIHFLYLV